MAVGEAEKDKEAEGDEDDAMEVDAAATTDVADEGTGPVETIEFAATPAPAGDKVDGISSAIGSTALATLDDNVDLELA